MTLIQELHDFVTAQAAEDAVLSPRERTHQAELVADVLKQEAPSSQAFKQLLKLYRSQRQAA